MRNTVRRLRAPFSAHRLPRCVGADARVARVLCFSLRTPHSTVSPGTLRHRPRPRSLSRAPPRTQVPYGTVRARSSSTAKRAFGFVRLRRVLCVLRVCSCRQCASGPPVHARGGHELVLIPASRPGRFRVPRAHQDVGVIMPTTSSASPADGDASAPSSPRSTRC